MLKLSRGQLFAAGLLVCIGVFPLGQVAHAAPPADSPAPSDLRTRRTGDDWPGFLGPSGDSKSDETGILTDWPAAGPRIVWQTKLGTSYGASAVSLGRLFHFDRYRDTARLTAVKSETGEALWRFGYPTDYQDLYGYNNGPRSCPVVDGERVYIFGAEGMLHCLNVEDGKVLWAVDTAKKFGVIQNFFGVGSAPAIEGDLLIVQIGGGPEESQSVPPGQLNRVIGNGSGVVAFDKRSGEVKYEITDELASYSSPTLATIAGRRWCFVFARGGLIGFEPATGKVDFHFPWRDKGLESVNASNPVVVGESVFISETYGPGGALLKVYPGGCKPVWTDEAKGRKKAMQTHWNTAVHHEGFLYGSSGRHPDDAELRCIELATGKVMWSEPDLTRSSLLYVDGHFVCLTEYGQLLLIKATPEAFVEVVRVELTERPKAGPALPGQPIIGQRTPLLAYPAWAAPVLSHGLLYVRGENRLVCLELIPPPGPDADER